MSVPLSTLSMNQRLASHITKIQTNLATKGEEMGSGRHTDLAASTGARFADLIDMRADFNRLNAQALGLDVFERSADAKQSVMGELSSTLQDFLGSMSPAVSDLNALSRDLPTLARQALDHITDLLNTPDKDGFLFAGVARSSRPMVGPAEGPAPTPRDFVSANALPNPPSTLADVAALTASFDTMFDAVSFDGVFYNGAPGGPGQARWQIPIGGQTSLDLGLQGNDPAIRDILQGLYMLAAVDVGKLPNEIEPPLTADMDRNSPYWAFMAAAFDKIAGGAEAVNEAQAELGREQATAEDLRTVITSKKILLSSSINDIEQVDPFETQIRFATLQSQLEQSFQVTARLASLSLSNYL